MKAFQQIFARFGIDWATPVVCLLLAFGGIGGVMTSSRARRQGCAGRAMRRAGEVMAQAGCDFGLLFCETQNVGFYERLGWQIFAGTVFCEQPGGRIKFEMMHTMILPLRRTPSTEAVDLCGLPW